MNGTSFNWDTSYTPPPLLSISGQVPQQTGKTVKLSPSIRENAVIGEDSPENLISNTSIFFQITLSILGVCVVIALTYPPFLLTKVKPPEVRCMSPIRISVFLIVVGFVTFVASRIGIRSVIQTIPSVLKTSKNTFLRR